MKSNYRFLMWLLRVCRAYCDLSVFIVLLFSQQHAFSGKAQYRFYLDSNLARAIASMMFCVVYDAELPRGDTMYRFI